MTPVVYVSYTKLRTSASIVFETMHVGFPTAKVWPFFVGRCESPAMQGWTYPLGVLHSSLISDFIDHHADNYGRGVPMVILDGDIIFHDKVEDWKFDTLLAGYRIPMIYNDFSLCVSLPRLHTSMLWIRDAVELKERMDSYYPPAKGKAGENCPINLLESRVMVINGRPIFWDTCCGLYQAFGGTAFTDEQKAAYTHLHSASFYDVMIERLENKEGFKYLHEEGYRNKEVMKEYTRLVDEYYEIKHIQALTESRVTTPA